MEREERGKEKGKSLAPQPPKAGDATGKQWSLRRHILLEVAYSHDTCNATWVARCL